MTSVGHRRNLVGFLGSTGRCHLFLFLLAHWKGYKSRKAFLSPFYALISNRKHATQASIQGSQEGRLQGQETHRGQEAQEEEEGVILHLHLQSAEAGAPRHWNLQQGHVYHELLRE